MNGCNSFVHCLRTPHLTTQNFNVAIFCSRGSSPIVDGEACLVDFFDFLSDFTFSGFCFLLCFFSAGVLDDLRFLCGGGESSITSEYSSSSSSSFDFVLTFSSVTLGCFDCVLFFGDLVLAVFLGDGVGAGSDDVASCSV